LQRATAALPLEPEPGQVVTLVIYRYAVIDVVWKPEIKKWALLRVLKNFLR
jgi:hypothetical protein